MSLSNAFETALLNHLFNNAAIANVGDATGLPASATAGVLYMSLHIADPGEAGNQASSEAAYTSYARVAIARTAGGWTVSGATAVNAAAINFPAATGGSATATHFGIGTSSSGAGLLLVSGPLGASMAITTGITPTFNAGQVTLTAD